MTMQSTNLLPELRKLPGGDTDRRWSFREIMTGLVNTDRAMYAANQISATLTAPFVSNLLETQTQIPKYYGKGGHGFAAEDANTLADRLSGKWKAKVVGKSNELNGPDRIVSGVKVQSKYYQSAYETIRSAFDPASGKYRYPGQMLEVPNDQYQECLKRMRDRIRNGEIPGVTNPADAEKLVKQGTVTYKQARNIARAGNIDSLKFDFKTQSITSGVVSGISFVIVWAQARRQGISTSEAIKAALRSALESGGTTLVTGVVGDQLLRTRAAAIGAVSVRGGVRAASHTSLGRATIHRIATGSLGKGVYGAAAVNHVSKLLRTNFITGTVVATVTCTPDFYRAAFDRSISWKQFMKNTFVNVARVTGGFGGWMGGAAAGAAFGSVFPFVGTTIGGFVGGALGAMTGGFGAGKAAKAMADGVVDDDSKRLRKALEEELQVLAFEYMLTEDELKQIIGIVSKTIDQKWFRRMYKETQGNENSFCGFVRREFEEKYLSIIRKRAIVVPPSDKEYEKEVLNLALNITGLTHDDLFYYKNKPRIDETARTFRGRVRELSAAPGF